MEETDVLTLLFLLLRARRAFVVMMAVLLHVTAYLSSSLVPFICAYFKSHRSFLCSFRFAFCLG
jgi:hypothetical protein